MIQNDMGNHSRVNGKVKSVDKAVGGTHVRSRVVVVLFQVEHAALVEGMRHVVELSKVIVDSVAVDGQVRRVPSVGVPGAKNGKPYDKHAAGHVEG